jgi:hypothetical protein
MRLDGHVIAINKLIAEAQELCDVGGLNKFRELFCPRLGKSQAYALRVIAAGKKTLEEHRTGERERKQKSRAKQRAAASKSGTVPEKPTPRDAPTGAGLVEHPNTEVEQTQEPPSKPWKARATVQGMRVFTAHTTELHKAIEKRPAQHFCETAASLEIVEHLANFYTDLANIMKSEALKATPAELERRTVSDGQPVGDTKVDHLVPHAEEPRP